MHINQRVLYDGSGILGRGLTRIGHAIITDIKTEGIEIKFDDGFEIFIISPNIKYRIKELKDGPDSSNPIK